MKIVKSLEDILATLEAINKAYLNRKTDLIQISIKGGVPIREKRDIPTRDILSKYFEIHPDSANRRIEKLVAKGLLEIDSERSYQGYKAYQRVYKLTGKGLQFLTINSDLVK